MNLWKRLFGSSSSEPATTPSENPQGTQNPLQPPPAAIVPSPPEPAKEKKSTIALFAATRQFGSSELSEQIWDCLYRSFPKSIGEVSSNRSSGVKFCYITIKARDPIAAFQAGLELIKSNLQQRAAEIREENSFLRPEMREKYSRPADYDLDHDLRAVYHASDGKWPDFDLAKEIPHSDGTSYTWLWPQTPTGATAETNQDSVMRGQIVDWFYRSGHVPYESMIQRPDFFFEHVCVCVGLSISDLPDVPTKRGLEADRKTVHGSYSQIKSFCVDTFGPHNVKSINYKIVTCSCRDPFGADGNLVLLLRANADTSKIQCESVDFGDD